VVGPILVERGEIDESLQALENTLQLSRQSNFAAGVVATQMIQSWLYAMLGDLEHAKQYQPLIKDFVQQYESFRPLYFVNLAQNEIYAGEYEKALNTFNQVADTYKTYSELIFHPYIYSLHIEIHLENEKYELALEIVETYLNSLSHQQVKILMPDMLNQKARALIGLERGRQAYDTLIQARTLAMQQNSRRSLWALLLDLADLEQDPHSAEEMREQARQIITYISEHISDPGLRSKFLNLPRVKAAHE
jgi:tetratricopeptide (TPR) repeat protein